jgi:hypothetical protein
MTPTERGLEVQLGLLATAAAQRNAGAGVSFAAGSRRWQAGVLATASLAERSDMNATERSAELRIPITWRAGGESWRVSLGPELTFVIDHASGNDRSGWRLAPGGGAAAGAIYMMSGVVGLGVDLHADVTPASWTKRFALNDGTEVLKPAAFRGVVCAGLFFVWGR